MRKEKNVLKHSDLLILIQWLERHSQELTEYSSEDIANQLRPIIHNIQPAHVAKRAKEGGYQLKPVQRKASKPYKNRTRVIGIAVLQIVHALDIELDEDTRRGLEYIAEH